MKELSIEQKAKAYDEAIKRARAYKGQDVRCALEEIFPELKESEDNERVRKELLNVVNNLVLPDEQQSRFIAWLEKQGEHANFRNKIQVGDKVTRNKDGVLVNLSQLNRAAKPADSLEPKFEIGDLITNGILVGKIDEIHEWGYHAYFGDHYADVPDIENWHKWTIEDIKNGDVLSYRDSQWIFIYKEKIDDSSFYYHALYSTIHQDLTINDSAFTLLGDAIIPATKEQRDLLFQKIKEAGYEWDSEKKELKKIIKEVNGEDYGIDGLWHAQTILEKTLGSVEGYQSDDGILEHMAAINAVKKLYEYKPAEWSEEDEQLYNDLSDTYYYNDEDYPEETYKLMLKRVLDWMTKRAKFLKHQKQWKPSEKQMKALHDINLTGNISYAGQGQLLIELYNDLKNYKTTLNYD